MRARRVATIVSTWLVAIVTMCALPVAQLAVAGPAAPSCCCPRPAQCKCPDHHPGRSTPETVRACHGLPGATSVSPLPVFAAAPRPRWIAPARALAIVAIPLPAPHVPPAPDEPAAPS